MNVQDEGGVKMKEVLTVGWVIKRYVKLRGYTVIRIAQILGINYKTLNGAINRNSVDAELLFELANLLDIDLDWMAKLFDKHRNISCLDPYQIPRMSEEFRNLELRIVLKNLDRHIQESPRSIAEIKRALLMDYGQRLYYLLDVLLPAEYAIKVVREKGHERYFCSCPQLSPHKPTLHRGRMVYQLSCEGNEKLKEIISERKEKIINENSIL
jgi:transcriptional regulator with XRE-family HTH domain